MKLLGLLGGMSWQSTETYYRLINEGVGARLGGLHSARLLCSSIDFAPLEAMQASGDWESAARLLCKESQRLERAGAEALMLCTNTMHNVADAIESQAGIPLLHIADATGRALQAQGVKKVGLLGTRFTMEQDFYKARLVERFGLEVVVPDPSGRTMAHNVIYGELCLGEIRDESRDLYLRIIDQLMQRGAEAVILGCTEIGLLVKQADTEAPLVDTTIVHAESAIEFLCEDAG